MSESDVTLATRLLSNMTAAERKRVKQKIEALLAGDSEALHVDTEEEMIYTAIRTAMSDISHESYPPLKKMDGKKRKAFNETALHIHEWVDKWVPNLTRTERLSVYQLLSQLAVSAARKAKDKDRQPLPFVLNVVLSQLNRVGVLVNDAYPGYLENGYFVKVIQNRLRGNRDVRSERNQQTSAQ